MRLELTLFIYPFYPKSRISLRCCYAILVEELLCLLLWFLMPLVWVTPFAILASLLFDHLSWGSAGFLTALKRKGLFWSGLAILCWSLLWALVLLVVRHRCGHQLLPVAVTLALALGPWVSAVRRGRSYSSIPLRNMPTGEE